MTMPRSEPPPEPRGAGPAVLVVDDEELFTRAVGKKLGQSGMECELALDLAGARDRLAGRRPDLILLDVRLPDGSGLDFLRELRAGRPFVHLDCAALPGDLIEAELFGHERGAFTHAHTARTGLIEAAEDGTVYLDEIGELPLELQSRLLAVLERREVRRIGSTRPRPVAAWFIAATNRDLDDMVSRGGFRSDLYFRLKVLSLDIPPLRERLDDLAPLFEHFAMLTARRYGMPPPVLSPELLEAARRHDWPGNVRELAHTVERTILLGAGRRPDAQSLGLAPAPPVDTADPVDALDGLTLDEAERRLIARALHETGGNVSESARRFGVSRMALRYRIQKLGIDPRRSRAGEPVESGHGSPAPRWPEG